MNQPNEDQNKQNKPYKRETLIPIPESESQVLNIQQSKILENKFGIDILKQLSTVNLEHLYFYHYKCESINDLNWGCAWRSMQTVLKYQLSLSNQKKDKDIKFYNHFMKYGDKNTLINIFKEMTKNQDKSEAVNKLFKKKFAPFEIDCGWAEPFISQLILYDFGFEGELFLINGYSTHSYAPKEVFSKTLKFSEFTEKLKNHFQQENPAPIIMDDSYISVCIIGVKFNENNNIVLLIMDPHVGDVKVVDNGIYIIFLNDEGIPLGKIPDKDVLVSNAVYFDNKNWMAYFPKKIK